MKKQTGFTLIELAIVLIIIGLLMGTALAGQQLINSARVKNLATDFKNIPTYLYGYQDRFKSIPGDDASADIHMSGATIATATVGNGVIEGAWNSEITSDESLLFWQHVRMAGFAPGITDINVSNMNSFLPANGEGGRLGIQSFPENTIVGLGGSYAVCSGGIAGRLAKELDVLMDDGDTTTGSMRVASENGAIPALSVPITAPGFDSTKYFVCLAF